MLKLQVSVIIPTHNGEKSISGLLESLFKQTFKDFEIIVIDDGSSDQTKSKVYGYIKDHPHKLRYFYQENKGPSSARNKGVKEAGGDIIIFLDDDALVPPGFVGAHLEAYKDRKILGLRGKILPKDASIYHFFQSHYDLGDKVVPALISTEGNCSFRKNAIIEAGGFSSNLFGGEGDDLSKRIIRIYKDKGHLVYYPDAAIYHNYANNFIDFINKIIRHGKHKGRQLVNSNTRFFKLLKIEDLKDIFIPPVIHWWRIYKKETDFGFFDFIKGTITSSIYKIVKKTAEMIGFISSKKNRLERILFVHSNSDIIGGQELSLIIRIRGLEQKGVTSLVLIPGKGKFSELLKESNIEYRLLRLNRLRKSNPFPYLKTVLSVYNLIRREGVVIIHTSGAYPAQYCLIAARLAGIPCIAHINNTVYSKGDLKKSFINYVDRVIAISGSVKVDILNKIRYPSDKIRVIYNPITDESALKMTSVNELRSLESVFGISDSIKIIGQVGQIIPRKGLECFVEMAWRIKKSYKEVKFMIVGEAPPGYQDYKGKIKQLIEEKGLTGDFIFTGFQKDIFKFISLLDISVNSSLADGGPRIVAESMALGKPVLTTSVGFTPEIIRNRRNGYLFTLNNPKAMAEAAIELLSNKNKRDEVSKEAKESISKQFSVDHCSKRLIEVYRELLFKEKKVKQNILFYEASSGLSGSANALVHIINYLNRKDYNPIAAITNYGAKIGEIRDAKIVKLKHRDEPGHLSNAGFMLFCLKHYIPEIIKIYLLIKKEKINLVHINNNIISGIPAIIASKAAGVSCVSHLRETRRLIRREKYFARFVSKFFALNKKAYQVYKEDIPEDKLNIIYDGIALSDSSSDDRGSFRKELNLDSSVLIGTVGRIVRGKGQREFILAAKKVLKIKPDARFVIVGDSLGEDNRYKGEVEELVKKENLLGQIIFTGWRDDIRNILSDLDILVLPSTTYPEGLPNSIIEAMALRKPVVASNIPGPDEIVLDGQTGFLVKPGDINQLAEKIQILISDPKLANALGTRARIRTEELFDMSEKIKELERIYEGLLSR